LKGHVSEREQFYIEASNAYEDAVSGIPPPSLSAQELPLLRKLVKQYPNDTQARIFLANAVGGKEALAIYQSILKDNPEDSAANHYYIHALEGNAHPEEALHSAEILASLAPASGHMVHMPGHIFFRIGDYARAEQSFAASMKVDEQYMRDQHVQPDNDWNYVHNLMYAIANLMEEGKMSAATALSMKLTDARGKLESTLYIYSTRDSMSRLNPRLPVALRTADWRQVIELLRAATPPAGRPNLDFLASQLAIFAVGMQAVEAHDLPKAQELSTRFDAGLKSKEGIQGLPENKPRTDPPKATTKIAVNPDALLRPLLSSLSIMALELRAYLLTAQGKPTDAKTLFDKAAKAEKALGYHEPPGYIRPVAETEAAAMMAIGDWTDATAAYEQALAERPRSGFALYGIAVSKEKSGNEEGAAKAYADFLTAWKDADPAELQRRAAASPIQ
jgi:tetratricopeptide (TPR) repeat protein